MAGKVTPMKVKLQAAISTYAAGGEVNVAALCREAGVSRKTFYKWAGRFVDDGSEWWKEQSRRPLRSPQQTAADVEDEIVRFRKELGDAGLDHGASTIQWKLGQDPELNGRVPSVATVHRILRRRGLVAPAPRKRPKSSWRRFEAAAPNERWQIDAMDWVVGTGTVQVLNVLDDHSRLLVGSTACRTATSDAAWAAFTAAATIWGLPAGVLSDNGLCFSGKLRGFEVLFEKNLRNAGVRPSTGRPYHPQTTGKVERFQQTLKKWLRRQPLAADLTELQDQLDRFGHHYNYERPHQGIGRQRPIQRWNATPRATAAPEPLEHPPPRPRTTTNTVRADGKIVLGSYTIHLGVTWAGHPAVIHTDGTNVNVFVNGELIRELTLDPTRTYQPSGRKRGGTRQPRLPS
jgi:transposase InsO family protein